MAVCQSSRWIKGSRGAVEIDLTSWESLVRAGLTLYTAFYCMYYALNLLR